MSAPDLEVPRSGDASYPFLGRLTPRYIRLAPHHFAPSPARARIRHQARDGLTAAAVSLVASIGVTAFCWALGKWLG